MNSSPKKRLLSHRHPSGLDRFWFGSPYYPEHWEAKDCVFDIERMVAANFNMVRMAEFAWDVIEAKENSFDFTLFDETIAKLGENGIYTMMCTPTATPPRWLTLKYPEMARVDVNGIPMEHGSRQHCCHSNPTFREYSRRITRAMTEHYATNPYVLSWQTDNEFNCHFSECHCASCQVEFQNFLRQKFNDDINELNRRWGTSFWGLTYADFTDIRTTKRNRPAHENPAAALDYARFLSNQITVFQRDQIEIMREANPNWVIMHNGLMPKIEYHGEFCEDLDVLGYDCYPFFSKNRKDRVISHRFNLDRARAASGNFMIPEHQSGPGGQAPYFLDTPEPGEIEQMTYRSISRGADSILHFRWRTCRFGAEEYWCGIIDHDNIPRRRYDEMKRIGDAVKRIGPEILNTSVHIDCAVALQDYDVDESYTTYTQGLPSHKYIAERFHGELANRGFAVGCVHPDDDLSGIKLYLIPHWALFKAEWMPGLTEFVENGGTLVVGAKTGTRDIDNNVIPETAPGLLRELCGLTVEEYGRQNNTEERPLNIVCEEKSLLSKEWYEILKPDAGTQTLATWEGRHLTGETAITLKNVGKGKVIYVGSYITPEMHQLLIPKLIDLAQLSPIWPEIPAEVEVTRRDGANHQVWFFINNTDEKVTIPKTPSGKNLLTGENHDGSPTTLERHGTLIISRSK